MIPLARARVAVGVRYRTALNASPFIARVAIPLRVLRGVIGGCIFVGYATLGAYSIPTI